MILVQLWVVLLISIHVPRAGDDSGVVDVVDAFKISIHVPRAGDDNPNKYTEIRDLHFNPRPPCGGRQYIVGNRWMY